MTQETLQTGSKMPQFVLKNVDGNIIASSQYQGRALCIVFSCNHCPFVHAYESRIIELAKQFPKVQFLLINSNDPENYPEDSFERMRKRAKEKNYPFPYLIDESQEIAILFGAACTPDPFLFNSKHELVYRGRIDDNAKNQNAVKEQSLRNAINAMLEGKEPIKPQFPAVGCSIKWK